ncbi:hypothetical protein ACQP2P_00445 [Dactylosporangium sp. CA-139114]|uniref:hypothetical protein n=1 Tax=Dactylosporangium sp. CA-139114 TaxID=3239931 RepID=UPI003D964F94
MSQQNFLGIPVDGEITRADPRVRQRPLSDLEPLIRALLDDSTIVEFGWTQYTPYFNDGEPCVFRVNPPWFRTPDDPVLDPQLTYELSLRGDEHPTLGGRPFQWADGQYRDLPYVGPDEERYNRARLLSDAFDSGAFDDVLLEAFGEHAHITVRRSGITVDRYAHE